MEFEISEIDMKILTLKQQREKLKSKEQELIKAMQKKFIFGTVGKR